VCWAGSFVIDWLISAGGGLLYMPMTTWSVSTCTVDLVVIIDKKLWVGSWLFKNWIFFFSSQCAIFGSKCFGCTDWVALLDAAGYSSTWVDWGWICIIELGYKVFCVEVWFFAKFDTLLDFIEMLLNSSFELLFCVSYAQYIFPVLLHLTL